MGKSVFTRRVGGFGWLWPEHDPPEGEQGCIVIGHDTEHGPEHRYYDRTAHQKIPHEHVVAMDKAPEIEAISVVRSDMDGMFIVRKGRRRVKTARLVNELRIQRGEGDLIRLRAIVKSGRDDDAVLAIATENLLRRRVTLMEEHNYCARLRDNGYNAAEIAERLAKSAGWVSKRLSLDNASDELVAMIDDDRIATGDALRLAALSRDEQREAIAEAAERASAAGKAKLSFAKPNGARRISKKIRERLVADERLSHEVRRFIMWMNGAEVEVPGLAEAMEETDG